MNAVKKYRIVLSIVIVLVIIATISAIYYYTGNKNNFAYKYLLKEYEQQIGIYNVGEKSPFELIDVYVYNLPPTDQEQLKNGIYVSDKNKLDTLVQDYES